MSVYFRVKFDVSSIILTSFRQEREERVIIFPQPSPTSKQTPRKRTQIRVKTGQPLKQVENNSNILIALWKYFIKTKCWHMHSNLENHTKLIKIYYRPATEEY